MIINWIEDLISIGLFLAFIACGILIGFGLPLGLIYLFCRAMHFLYTGVW
jgi:hypothetical protein